jgi:hypothetical protein
VALSIALERALPPAGISARMVVVSEPELSDSELLLRVGNGDGWAFEKLYRPRAAQAR